MPRGSDMIAATAIKPIRTVADYRHALGLIDEIVLMDAAERDHDTLDVLAVLVHQYEEEHYPVDPPDPIDAILFRLDQQGLTRADLARFLGSRARVSEVLSRKRPLSVAMMRSLHQELGVPADILLRGAQLKASRRHVRPSKHASKRRRQTSVG